MEAPAVVDLSASLVPLTIRHADLDLSWSVLEMKRYWVRVTGPMPGRPSEAGEFGMIIRRYGDRPCWWICPEPGESRRP